MLNSEDKMFDRICKNLSNIKFKINRWRFIEVIIATITIIAFFYAINFFTSTAKIEISNQIPFPPNISLKLISDFYAQNGKKIPTALTPLFHNKNLKDDNLVTSTSPEIYILENIEQWNKIDGFWEKRISALESVLGNHDYKPTVAGKGYIFGECLDTADFRNLLKKAKKLLEEKDYYIFLISGLNSYCIHNHVTIKNVGEVDLKNIEVFIPSPESRITDKRDNNIIKTLFEPKMFHKTKIDSSGITINIPMIKRNNSFHVTIASKENQIFTDEATYSFDNDYVINKPKLFIGFCAILLFMIFFCDVFTRKS